MNASSALTAPPLNARLNQYSSMSIKSLINKYKTDKKFHDQVGLYVGATINLAFVVVQLYGGIKYQSVWFTALAIYNAILAGVKFYIGKSIDKTGQSGWTVFRIVGLVMSILNVALITMISIMIADPSIAIHKYGLDIAIIIAVWTIISTIIAIKEVVKTHKKNEPVAIASRLVQLVKSAVSILMLQTAMIASITTAEIEKAKETIEQVGSATNAPNEITVLTTNLFQDLATSNAITGGIVALLAGAVTLYMIIRGTIEKKKTL